MNGRIMKKESKAGEILATAVAKVLVGGMFVAGIVIVLGVCFLLRSGSPYRCWHRYCWC